MAESKTGYSLTLASSLETLRLELDPELVLPDPFEETGLLIIQNRNMEEWLRLRQAAVTGFCAPIPFLLPEAALRRLLEAFPSGHALEQKSVLFMDDLKLVLYKTLEKILVEKKVSGSEEVFSGLRDYVRGPERSGTGEKGRLISQGRLYEWANATAGIFQHYAMNLGSLADAWESGHPAHLGPSADEADRRHEAWQRWLWSHIFSEGSPYVHLGRILHKITEGAETPLDGARLPRVSLFGSAFLSHAAFTFFLHLSRFTEVRHYLLAPWNPKHSDSEEGFFAPARTWGRIYADFSSLLRTLEPGRVRVISPEDTAEEGLPQETLLSELQKSLWKAAPLMAPVREATVREATFRGAPQEGTVGEPTNRRIPLTIVSCTGLRREVEVLKDKILYLLSPMDGEPGLAPQDIGVMAPDIGDYASYIEEIFADLPRNIIDLPSTESSPLFQGLALLLKLPGSRFAITDLFPLFDNPAFRQSRGISADDAERWKTACRQAGIRWGKDEAHQSDLGTLPGGRFTWEGGFERVLAGLAWGQEDLPLPSGRILAPLPPPKPGEWSLEGRLMETIRSLYRDFYALHRKSLSLAEWARLFSGELLDRYLRPRPEVPSDLREHETLQRAVSHLSVLHRTLEAAPEMFAGNRLAFSAFQRLLQEEIENSLGFRGAYLSGGITFSSLRPLRALPFEAIFLLGMNEGRYPAPDDRLSFDLRDLMPQPMDFSRRSSEKYAFLETLVSARRSLVISYQGRDAVSGQELPASPLVTELTEFCETAGRPIRREDHPLQGYDRRYFEAGSGLWTYDPAKSAQAAAFYRYPKPFRPPLFTPAARDTPLPAANKVDFTSLYLFLRNPVKFHLRRVLGLRLPGEEDEDKGDEPVSPDFFLKRAWGISILEAPPDDGSWREQWSRWQRQAAVTEHPLLTETEGEDLAWWENAYRDRRRELEELCPGLLGAVRLLLRFAPDGPTLPRAEDGELVLRCPVWDLADRTRAVLEGGGPEIRWLEADGGTICWISHTMSSSVRFEHLWKGALIALALSRLGMDAERFRAFVIRPEGICEARFSFSEASASALLEAFRLNLQSPVPLYNDLLPPPGRAQDLEKALAKAEALFTREEGFTQVSSDPETLANCPYGQLAFPQCKFDFTDPRIKDFFQHFLLRMEAAL